MARDSATGHFVGGFDPDDDDNTQTVRTQRGAEALRADEELYRADQNNTKNKQRGGK